MKGFIISFLGWTALLDIPVVLGLVLLFMAFKAYLRFHPEEPYFELFITHTLYPEYDDPIYSLVSNPNAGERLNIEWIVNENDLRSLKEPRMKIINHGGSFYADTRDVEDNFWIHAEYITYRGIEIDTSWDGMWCGTGMFYQRIPTGAEIEYTWYYSLFDKISTPDYYPRTEDIQPDSAIDEIFGDSTQIYWTLSTFSVPWSSYVPQLVESPRFMLYPSDLKKNWRKLVGTRSRLPLFLWYRKRYLNDF